MTQRLVVISDIHVHPWSAFAKGTGAANTRLRSTLDVIRDSLAHAESIGAPWICAGDIVHTAGHTKNIVLNLIIESLNEFPSVKKIMIWGNHDSRGKGRSRVTPDEAVPSAIEQAVRNAILLDREDIVLDSGLRVYGEGAQPKREYYGWPEISDGSYDVGVFHFTVHETCSPSGFFFESEIQARELLSRFPLTLVGDIHHPQEVLWEQEGDEDQRLLLVPGAPEHHNFGDRGARGFWDIEMEERDGRWWPVAWTMHPSKSPLFLTVDSVKDVEDAHNFYRIRGAVDQAEIPENATVVGSGPTTIEQRRLFAEGATVKEILSTWITHIGPPKGVNAGTLLGAGLDYLELDELYQMKPARVKRIVAENFVSYEHLDFTPQDGVTLVVGESRDYASNGAGKSTIFEALYWCLFGKTTKGVASGDEIRRGQKSCEVTVQLEVDGNEVSVYRKRRGRKVEVEAVVGSEPVKGKSAGEVTDALCRYLGVSESIFRALAYYSQEQVLLFSRLTDGDRKSLLGELCGLEAYETAANVAREAARNSTSDLERAGLALENAGTREEDLRIAVEDKRSQMDEWTAEMAVKIKAAEARWDKKRIKAALQRQERLRALWDERTEEQRSDIQETLFGAAKIALAEHRKEAESDLRGFPYPEMIVHSDRKSEKAAWEAKLGPTTARAYELQGEIGRLERGITALKSKIDDAGLGLKAAMAKKAGEECPTCGQVLTKTHVEQIIQERSDILMELKRLHKEAEEKIAPLYEELDAAESDVQSVQSRLREFKKYVEAEEKLERVLGMIEDANQTAWEQANEFIQKDKERQRQRMASLRDRILRYEAAVKQEISQLRSTVNPYADAWAHLTEEYDEMSGVVLAAQEKVDSLEMELTIAEYWAKGFSKQGIQSLLLEEVAAEFNRLRSDVFPLLTHGTIDVQFSTTSETRKGEARERTEFQVALNGESVPYETLSGGQRRRVDLGVMLTLAAANAATRGVPGVLGVLIFDEVFDYLDSDGAEGLLDALQEVNQIVPNIYVITQDNEMKSLFPQVIEVVQDKQGISRIA